MKKLLPYSVLVLVAVLLVVFESDYLYRVQEEGLFLHTPLFFRQSMVASGGLLTWAGAYLTQSLFHPAIGVSLLCLIWAFLMWELQRAFHIPHRWMWLTLLPIACLLLTVVDLGYWVYYLKLPGYLFDATLGTMIAVALAWAYRSVTERFGLRLLFVVVSTCISYPLFGFYGLWGTLMMVLMAWGIGSRYRLATTLLAVAAVLLVPLACYQWIYHETHIVNIYWTALPVFVHQGVRCFAYNLPYIFLVVTTTALVCFCKKGFREKVSLTSATRWLQPALLAVAALCVAGGWFTDDNFHRELSMSRQMEKHDWQAMLRTFSGAKGEPTRAMCMMRNLALQRQGRLSSDARRYREGFARPRAPFVIHTIHTIGKPLYLEYGLPNYCYRWCIEDGVEYGWSVEKLKLMVRCSLLNGEMEAAQRYLSMLRKTDTQKDFVSHYDQYLRQPSLVMSSDDFRPILPLLRSDNFLTSDMTQQEIFLIEHFASSEGATPEQRELANFYFPYYFNRPRYVEK